MRFVDHTGQEDEPEHSLGRLQAERSGPGRAARNGAR